MQALADATGIPYKDLQRYETGLRPVSLQRLKIIAEALKLPAGDLIDGAALDLTERLLLEQFRQLRPEDRERVIKIVQAFRSAA